MKSKVLVILGPTASGKSDLAVKLAKKFKGEIISADSRQVYKGLNAGSGKITKKEMRGVPHHLLDVADPKKVFTAAEYKTLAEKALANITAKGKLPIVVGGTGFYIDTLAGTVSLPEVPPNKALRKKLEAKTVEALFKLLQKKDPRRAKSIDKHNKVRLVRALEIIEALGSVPKPAHQKSRTANFVYIGLRPDQKVLEERIYKRLTARMPGMIREAKNLKADGLPYKRMEALGLEYRYLARYLQGKLTKSEMTQELFAESKKYSKRQIQWFKRNKAIKWFKPEETRSIEKYLKNNISKDTR